MARIRRNASRLPAGDQTFEWYGRAILKMQERSIVDPTSWRYQAAIHAYDPTTDPFAAPNEVRPAKNDVETFWNQCQHGSWYFLPWHRMYLHFFEQILLDQIVKMGGPADWALPYWNYSEVGGGSIPQPFLQPKLPDGSTNPLFVAERDAQANAGIALPQGDTTVAECLSRTKFAANLFGGSPGFGGPKTMFEHQGGSPGSLERIPHGSVHVDVGGWMSAFDTAALDPLFWLHHCNIDRLWEVWLQRDPMHTNPKTADWLSAVSFPFHDSSGAVVKVTPADVTKTQAAPLEYAYDDTADPIAHLAPPVNLRTTTRSGGRFMSGDAFSGTDPVPEMVGATPAPFRLEAAGTTQLLRVEPPKGPTKRKFGVGRKRRVFLNIEGIKSEQQSVPFDVYINVPAGSDPRTIPECYAGRLPMFGLREATRGNTNHPGSGLHYTLEITTIFEQLIKSPGWDPNALRLAFVPTREGASPAVTIERASLYYA